METGLRLIKEEGYATLTAVVLCAALSIVCAGALTLSQSLREREVRGLKQLQQEEAINSAVLRFVTDILSSDDPYVVTATKQVDANGQNFSITLTAQSEYAKWPLEKIDAVSETSLAKVTSLSKETLEHRSVDDDCVLSLFSPVGQVDPEKDKPVGKGALYVSSAKDGQVWRIRAALKNRVEERRVRFLGDPNHLFALLSLKRGTLGEMPECKSLKS